MPNIAAINGAPGSGKSTLAKKFKESVPNVYHVSAGDRLRAINTGQADSKYKDALLAQTSQLRESRPVDHELVTKIIFEFVEQCPTSAIVLLDGYPRYIDQINIFFDTLNSQGHLYLGALHLRISQATSIDRIVHRGTRIGEKPVTEEFVKWRFQEYNNLTVPAVELLTHYGPVIDVNVEDSLEKNIDRFNRSLKQLFVPQIH